MGCHQQREDDDKVQGKGFILVQVLSKRTSSSGVAKLGHTGTRALATGGCAPPVQALLKIIGAECTVINRGLGAKSAQRC